MRREKKENLNKSAASGAVALIFLVLGFQIAVFAMKVVERPAPDGKDYGSVKDSIPITGQNDERNRAGNGITKVQGQRKQRRIESFPFDPNTVSIEDLERLGLSRRQAESIESYRAKGGSFRRKEDFRKMYVVSDTLYERLEKYIEIPKVELNGADSAALVSLRGIGGYYAQRIIEYRDAMGGYHSPEQLMEIKGIDEERFSGFKEDIQIDTTLIRKIDLWTASRKRLESHPYLGERKAEAIERYKSVCDSSLWTIDQLLDNHVLNLSDVEKLKKYIEYQ